MLVDLIRRTDDELVALFATLPPGDRAIFSVAWAGEAESQNWFDVAREYTERWHHQQQIRDAVDQPGLTEPRFLRRVIATFARGLPHAYRNAAAPLDTAVAIEIDGDRWTVVRGETSWALAAVAGQPTATIVLAGDDAWRLWTKGLSAADARARARTTGPEDLIAPAFSFVAIMA
jgi:hypothetical protein